MNTNNDSTRQLLYRAAINCGHEITHDEIVLRVDPNQSGNALSQLADRLLAAVTASHFSDMKFEAVVHEQEQLAIKFCEEIAGKKGEKPSLPDPIRLLEMAHALYMAERASSL